MMRGFVPFLERHHNLRILDEAVSSAVRLSNRYLAGRQLPDKLANAAVARILSVRCVATKILRLEKVAVECVGE